MQLLKFKIFEDFAGDVLCAFTLRGLDFGLRSNNDKENLRKNYRILCEEFGLDEQKIVLAYQEHTDKVVMIIADTNTGNVANYGLDKPFLGVDAFITNKPGLALIVQVADCQAVFIFDPVLKIIAAIHCGWQGNTKNIIGKTVKKMASEFGCDAKNLLIAISPSLGPCCAEFTNPYEELPEFMHGYVGNNKKANRQVQGSPPGGLSVDLWQCSFDQLTACGVLAENIDIARRCTVCENDKFFSYRVENGKTGRMAGIIQILEKF